jgi:signal transduction histidine kinase
MILNLLDISRGEAGQLTPRKQTIDLPALTREIVEEVAVRASTNGVQLQLQVEVPQLVGDIDLLRRVLENLFDNALRHAPPNSAITLRAEASAHAVEIRVCDAGAGVPPELREKIFERFLQADTGERLITRTGRGLGLAFCKLAVEAHGGTIQVEAGEPGAIFRVVLPQD